MAIQAMTGEQNAKQRRTQSRRGGPGSDEHGRSRTWRKITDVHGPGRPEEEKRREEKKRRQVVLDLQVAAVPK